MRRLCFFLAIAMGAVALTSPCLGAEPSLSAVSAILINADTGTVLYEKNADEQRAMASTTKIMTALLTLEAGEPDRQFAVDSHAIRVEGTSMGLREGDIVTRRALCWGMLLPSGNDAANAAAVSVSGTPALFVEKMNRKAEALGMTDTHFVTPSGLDAQGHYSTARDMALLAMAALANPEFREICSSEYVSLEYGNPPFTRWLKNSNKLLSFYSGCIGVKTGFTDNARRCLVSAAEREGVTLIAVTLNAGDDWNDHKKMLDLGFSAVTMRTPEISLSELTVPVTGGEAARVPVTMEEELLLPLAAEELERLEIRTSLVPFLYAGFDEGEYAGSVSVLLDGKRLCRKTLVTAEGCPAVKNGDGLMDGILRFISALMG